MYRSRYQVEQASPRFAKSPKKISGSPLAPRRLPAKVARGTWVRCRDKRPAGSAGPEQKDFGRPGWPVKTSMIITRPAAGPMEGTGTKSVAAAFQLTSPATQKNYAWLRRLFHLLRALVDSEIF